MKKFRWVVYVILGVGISVLALALVLANETRGFVAQAASAPGTVIELFEFRRKKGASSNFRPVVKFAVPSGEEITFTSSYGSRPPAYQVGESVEVLYLPGDARIKGFAPLWAGPLIVGGIGVAFTAVGLCILLLGRANARKAKYLMAYGTAIQTDVQGVVHNRNRKARGRHPWRITSQWLDPASSKMRVFESANLWFDPTKFMTSKQVTVLLDPKDSTRYHMDVSFLPEMDEGT
ncbi:MAG: DUF3592 domain-containing protein [Pseudomonadota bacterium]